MANTPNSIIEEFAKVNNIINATPTSLRRALEPIIQEDSRMKTRSKALGMHSSTTGAKYYDKTAGIFKASAIHTGVRAHFFSLDPRNVSFFKSKSCSF